MNIPRILARRVISRCTNKFNRKYSTDIYEPDYLDAMKPPVPVYNTINLQLRGYDYSILENYQKFIHNIADNMDVNVEECWASPAQQLQVIVFKPQSEIPGAQHNFKLYERFIQIVDVAATQLPILLRVVESSIPPGVTVDVGYHQEWQEENRYVPDRELLELKQQLEDLGGASKKKN